ncbi:MAG: hypothetical protein GY930_09390 [bacterium]|nr:hypothetical protein [bacterium]
MAAPISNADGAAWTELDAGMMLKGLSGVFVVGETIRWDSPTGGFLRQACFSTAIHAAKPALNREGDSPPRGPPQGDRLLRSLPTSNNRSCSRVD